MEGIHDSSYFKTTLSWEDSECSLPSNEEILSKSGNGIFYDTNEHFLFWENISTKSNPNISDMEMHDTCSDFFENTESTNLISLPSPKTSLKTVSIKNVPDPSQNSNNLYTENNLQKQEDLEKVKEAYEVNKDVPLKILLRRMFDEILGNHTKESTKEINIPYSLKKLNDTPEINNNDESYQLTKNKNDWITSENANNFNKSNSLPSHSISIPDSIELYRKKLVTILEDPNENSNVSSQQNLYDWSAKCISKFTKLSSRKLKSQHYINDNVFIASDTDDSTTSASNTSSDIEIINKEFFKKMKNLKDNDSLESIIQNGSILYSDKKIISANNINNEEYNLFEVMNHNIPSILITPATPR